MNLLAVSGDRISIDRGTPMKSPVDLDLPGISPELLALNSIAVGCSTADRYLCKNALGISAAQQKAFLRETIFFHHFMAMDAVFYVLDQDIKSRNAYCDSMVAAINPGIRFPPNEELGLSPLTLFSARDRADAIRSCFFSTANIVACMAQDLYLARKPFESELKVMNLYSVKEMTRWDSPSANDVQYFCAALIARLTISLQIDPSERVIDIMNLSIHALAESQTAFKLYLGLLGAEVVVSGEDAKAPEPSKPKRSWLSGLFK